jgi:hypothetical protein
MRHLHSDELIDLAEGTRPESSAPHLRSCEACRRQLTELRAMMSAATQAEVPEPSPLFWDHFSARVRDAVAAEGAPRRAALFGLSGLSGWSWSSVLMPLSVGGCAAVLVAAALMFRSFSPGPMPGFTTPPSVSLAPAASIADAAPMADPADDPSLDLVANLAAQVDWEGAGDIGIGLRAHEDAADKAVSQLSDGERRELGRLLQEELSHSTN